MKLEGPLGTDAVIGILGGGQLGRMLALAAAEMGLRTHVYAPEPDSPAFDVTRRFTQADYEDEAALARFAESVDVVTYEFENVPSFTAHFLSARVPVLPNGAALEVTQDRFKEKTFARDCGLAVADFASVEDVASLDDALKRIGRPSVLKTRRFGYDGKGQTIIRETTDLSEAFATIGEAPAILEAFVPFEKEVSVIVARSVGGEVQAYDVCENEHKDHILHRTLVPARIEPALEEEAKAIATALVTKLNYVGVLTVELFVLPAGHARRLVVNEMAPRVHNSGHWTQDGAVTSQFSQHIRAICGWPLGDSHRTANIEMLNLIGHDADDWQVLLALKDSAPHLYGKSNVRKGRKMGHVTRLLPLSNAKA
jgi:5-(carboxyamino)imidazole ribonucleotide synthase